MLLLLSNNTYLTRGYCHLHVLDSQCVKDKNELILISTIQVVWLFSMYTTLLAESLTTLIFSVYRTTLWHGIRKNDFLHCTHLFLPAKCGQTLSDAEAKSFAVLHYKMKENKTKTTLVTMKGLCLCRAWWPCGDKEILHTKVVMLGTPDSKLLNLRAWPCNIMSGIVVFNYMALTLYHNCCIQLL